MPYGGNDWLALTQEPTLEPELPICDAHHHLWEFRPEPVPYQRYLLPELAEDLGSGHNVRTTVFYHPQLEELAAFARAVPDLTIVLNHIGGLVRIGAYANRDGEVLTAWRLGIAAVAACRGAGVGTRWGLRHTGDQAKFSFRPGSGHCILARRPESDRVM